jgi:short-subunit dehydrogenase
MEPRGRGTIVNIGSISGQITNIPQNQTVYNASKAAVHMLTKSLASEFAATGVRVNAVSPGYILTDMTRGGLDNPAWSKIWLDLTPMRRVGEPAEVAQAVLFLASDASTYITGEVLTIDGATLCAKRASAGADMRAFGLTLISAWFISRWPSWWPKKATSAVWPNAKARYAATDGA